MKRKFKCRARGQSTQWCDGCKALVLGSGKCPQRDKYRELRHSKKEIKLYGEYGINILVQKGDDM